MTTGATALGTGLGLGLLAGFPLLLAALPNDPDLRVDVGSPHAYAVRSSEREPLPPVALLPAPPPHGLRVTDTASGAGLDLRTWEVNYSNRWEREVTLPILTGPFAKDGDDVCGYSVRLGAGLFDKHGAGAGLVGLLRKRLAKQFPFTFSDKLADGRKDPRRAPPKGRVIRRRREAYRAETWSESGRDRALRSRDPEWVAQGSLPLS